jgi:hypothetical protein
MTISVYIDGSGGTVYEYDIPDLPHAAHEHTEQIIRNGYRHNDGAGDFVAIPPHRIFKVKATGFPIPTNYPDRVRGT